MSKRWTTWFVILAMGWGLFSCGGESENPPESPTTTAPPASGSTPPEEPSPASANPAVPTYKGGPVSQGGSISGVVKKKPPLPQDAQKEVKKNKAQCGDSIAAEQYVISQAGEVQWAVVILKDISEGKALDLDHALSPTTELVVDNKGCHFQPHVMVAPQGGNLAIKNSDPMLHNSHFSLIAGETKKDIINIALPQQNQVIQKKTILRKAGLLSVSCDAHDFMQGYIWVLPHPYGAVTDEKGRFTLTEVPAGDYTLKIWHEAFGEKEVPVTVKPGEKMVISPITYE